MVTFPGGKWFLGLSWLSGEAQEELSERGQGQGQDVFYTYCLIALETRNFGFMHLAIWNDFIIKNGIYKIEIPTAFFNLRLFTFLCFINLISY